MKLPAGLEKNFARFDALSMRERALVAGAALVALIMIWTLAVFDPLTKKERYPQQRNHDVCRKRLPRPRSR